MTTGRAPMVFLGPSLSRAEAEDILPAAVITPPARRGDFDAVEDSRIDEVILIDGVMVYDHPPSPSETHRLVARGIRVLGASSLGAFRAVELHAHGVEGVGWVYQQVRARNITADDELVARLDPRTGRAETIFVVNLRYAIAELALRGQVTAASAEATIRAVTALHFEARTPRAVVDLAVSHGMTPATAQRLLDPRFDIKAADASQALCASRHADPHRPAQRHLTRALV
jgi:hypothetical protein